MPRKSAAALAALVAAGSLSLLPGTASASTPTLPLVPAMPAAALVDTVGVNVHAYYDDTAYGDGPRLVRLVSDLGVRHVRDGVGVARKDQVDVVQGLAAKGIRSTMIVGRPSLTGVDGPDPAALAYLAGPLAGAVEAVEAPNEYDCSKDAEWAPRLRSYTKNLVQAVRQARLDLPVLAPSWCGLTSDAVYGPVGPDHTAANMHAYPQGEAPEHAIEGWKPLAERLAGTQRAVVTESGYHNALHAADGQPSVSEATAADYLPRLLLDNARVGVDRTFLYELFDQHVDTGLRDPERHFGLVRQDGTPKPGYTAVRNLLRAVAGGDPLALPTTPAAAAPLALRLQGGGASLRSLLVADADGSGHTLALWLADTREAHGTATTLPDRTAPVRVQLAGLHAATTREPSRGDAVTELGSDDAFDVPVRGTVTLLHLEPATTAAPGAPAATHAAASYGELQQADGAVVRHPLAATGGLAGARADDTVPGRAAVGATVTGAGQTERVPVPGAPTAWTIELWQRTDPSSAAGAAFLQVVGARGGQLRTYAIDKHPVGQMQLSGYGLPRPGAEWGQETWAQALPGAWHHLALTNDGTTTGLWVDGELRGTVPAAPHALTGVDVGAVSGGFRGAVAGLGVYPRALDAATLSRHAHTGELSCPCPGDGTAPSVPGASAVAPADLPVAAPVAAPAVPPVTVPAPPSVPVAAPVSPPAPVAAPAASTPRPVVPAPRRPSLGRYRAAVAKDRPLTTYRLDRPSDVPAGAGLAEGALPGSKALRITRSGTAVRSTAAQRTGRAWSVEAWVKVDPRSAAYAPFWTTKGAIGWGLLRSHQVAPAGRAGSALSAFGAPRAGRLPAVQHVARTTSGAWHHVVLSSGLTSVKLYVDGRLVSTQPAVGRAVPGWAFGSPGTSGFRGLLDEVAVYNKALDARQVAAHVAAAS